MPSNILYSVIGLTLLIARLLNDFQTDKGQNKKAKTFQTILLGFIVLCYTSSVRYIGWLFRHYNEALIRFTVDVGIVPGYIHFKIFLLNIILTIAVLILAFLMANRHQRARQQLFYLLPFLALTEIFNFYRGWLSDGEGNFNHGFVFSVAFIIVGGLTAFILVIYNSKFMRAFFDLKTSN